MDLLRAARGRRERGDHRGRGGRAGLSGVRMNWDRLARGGGGDAVRAVGGRWGGRERANSGRAVVSAQRDVDKALVVFSV